MCVVVRVDKVTTIGYESLPNPIGASVVKVALLTMTCCECVSMVGSWCIRNVSGAAAAAAASPALSSYIGCTQPQCSRECSLWIPSRGLHAVMLLAGVSFYDRIVKLQTQPACVHGKVRWIATAEWPN